MSSKFIFFIFLQSSGLLDNDCQMCPLRIIGFSVYRFCMDGCSELRTMPRSIQPNNEKQ